MVISPVRTYPIFLENREASIWWKLSSKKSNFLKPLSRVEIFENAGVSFLSMNSVQSSYRACVHYLFLEKKKNLCFEEYTDMFGY